MSDTQTRNVIMIVIGLVLALALAPTVTSMVASVTGVGGDNFTGAARTLALQINIFYVIIVIGVAVAGILKIL